MPATYTSGQQAQGRKPSPVRDRIVEAASELFYADGIRAVSADRIIAAAGVSKVTFYRHFPTKDDVVVAYLELRSSLERDAAELLRAAHVGDPEGMLVELARSMAAVSCEPGFRGCPYINAAAEYADADHPVRRTIARHRAWFTGMLRDLLGELGVDSPAAVDQLMMLRDGAMVDGYLGGSDETRAETLVAAGRAIVEAALRGRR